MKHFIDFKRLAATEAMEGALLGTIDTESLTIAYTDMKPGVEIPLHQHPEEAIDIMLEGILEMQVGDKATTLTHGMMSVVPSNIPHKAKAVTHCRVVTIFYPKRGL